jgi:beta-galactosidase
VPFQAGTLKAIAYKNGREVAAEEVRTAGPPAKIKLLPDRTVIQPDGDDLSFVTVRIEDKDGNLCPVADNLVHFSVKGSGAIAAVDNGSAATTEPFHADYRKAFNGLALLVVQSRAGQTGSIEIVPTSDGLKDAGAEVTAASLTPAGNRR